MQSGELPHLLVYGPSGAGKKTRIMCILREMYGSGADKLRVEHMSFTVSHDSHHPITVTTYLMLCTQTPSKKKLEISTISSNYHIEVNPSDAGIHDSVVVQELLKQVAQNQTLDASHKSFRGEHARRVCAWESFSQSPCAVVLLTEVEHLTKNAQHALRRTMEKYSSSCRLILSCTSTSKVIPAIRSRCLGVRMAAPSIQEVGQSRLRDVLGL